VAWGPGVIDRARLRALASRLIAMPTRGKLILCGTPIGNLEDATPRLARTLGQAHIVACEDTRRTRKLLTHLGVHARELVTYNETNERRRATELVERMKDGAIVALVSDAGMPGLSDPGYRLVRAAVDAGIATEVVPGPSAAISALAIAGIAPGRFVFEGFLPRKSSERKRHIETLVDEKRTLVFFESPHRVADALADLAEVLGPRSGALARELTKLHEEVVRGTLPELAEYAVKEPPRGEITLVVGGAVGTSKEAVEPEELARRTRALIAQGVDRKEAMQEVARAAGVSKRAVFDSLLKKDTE
jgi:16S rRNA (cytidine1402-2'-O)-methyltransferase